MLFSARFRFSRDYSLKTAQRSAIRGAIGCELSPTAPIHSSAVPACFQVSITSGRAGTSASSGSIPHEQRAEDSPPWAASAVRARPNLHRTLKKTYREPLIRRFPPIPCTCRSQFPAIAPPAGLIFRELAMRRFFPAVALRFRRPPGRRFFCAGRSPQMLPPRHELKAES